MITEITGKVLKFGDSIDTDVMLTGKYLDISTSETAELAKHAMEVIDPDFPQKVKTSPILVAGKNFGCGSSREQAPVALKGCGVAVILAETIARIFFRNAINIGMPIMVCPGITARVNEGDVLKVNLSSGEIENVTTGAKLKGERLPDFMLEIIENGGLIAHREKEMQS